MDDTLNKVSWQQAQPLPREIAKYLRFNFPQVTQTGIYEPRTIRGTNIPSAHAEGRAIDIHLRACKPNEKLVGDLLFRVLIESAYQTGIDNVIWNRQIWSMEHKGPRPFVGKYRNGALRNPHIDHIHVEFTRHGSQLKMFRVLQLRLDIIRGGLEELSGFYRTIA
jgi:hypothetical protein